MNTLNASTNATATIAPCTVGVAAPSAKTSDIHVEMDRSHITPIPVTATLVDSHHPLNELSLNRSGITISHIENFTEGNNLKPAASNLLNYLNETVAGDVTPFLDTRQQLPSECNEQRKVIEQFETHVTAFIKENAAQLLGLDPTKVEAIDVITAPKSTMGRKAGLNSSPVFHIHVHPNLQQLFNGFAGTFLMKHDMRNTPKVKLINLWMPISPAGKTIKNRLLGVIDHQDLDKQKLTTSMRLQPSWCSTIPVANCVAKDIGTEQKIYSLREARTGDFICFETFNTVHGVLNRLDLTEEDHTIRQSIEVRCFIKYVELP